MKISKVGDAPKSALKKILKRRGIFKSAENIQFQSLIWVPRFNIPEIAKFASAFHLEARGATKETASLKGQRYESSREIW